MPVTLPTPPHRVVDDTWIIPTFSAIPDGGWVPAHSLLIRGEEPVVVDTGSALLREQWLADLTSLIDPGDVRWIFLSHDDHDHAGNLATILDLCPEATLVGSFAIVARLAPELDLPLERMRWIDAGGHFDAGDRRLHLVRPPMFDSPATRGLFDASNGMLWAVDSFGSVAPGAVFERADLPDDLFAETFAALNGWNTPWMELVDPQRYADHVQATRELPLEVVASAHGPVLRGRQIDDAFDRTLALAAQPVLPMPGQDALDAMLAALAPVPEPV